MNILFLLRLWPVYGGGETVTICLANEMVKRGWRVSVAYFKDSVREQMPFVDERIKLLHINGIGCNEFVMNPADADKAQNAVIAYVKEQNVDVIINQWWEASYITRLKVETSTKIITCLHQAFYTPILDLNGWRGLVRKFFMPIYLIWKKYKNVNAVKKYLPYVDRYVFLSTSFQNQFEEFAHYNNASNKLCAMPNPTVFSEVISKDDYEHKEKVVLIVGRMFEGQKRLTRALRIWKQVETDARSTGWRLQMVGEGPDLPIYKQMAKDLCLQRISFEGYQQPLNYYKKARIFLMTSQFEGFSMTLVEAQQQGVVPIVMDSFLSLHDIIKNGDNGIISPNCDERAFSQSVLRLMSDANYLDKMAKQGMKTCLQFSVETVVSNWERIIKSM